MMQVFVPRPGWQITRGLELHTQLVQPFPSLNEIGSKVPCHILWEGLSKIGLKKQGLPYEDNNC